MALTYQTDQITLNAANTDFTILTASASTTLVKNITWVHAGHNTNVKLSLTKTGGTKTVIAEYAATAGTPLKIWTDILPLEANDILHLQSDHIGSADVGYCIISYVEDTTSVAGQSIAVHTDVDITGVANGDTLVWNGSSTQFEPGTGGTPISDTDDVPEGATNLYHTTARVDARIAAASVTDLSDVTSAGIRDCGPSYRGHGTCATVAGSARRGISSNRGGTTASRAVPVVKAVPAVITLTGRRRGRVSCAAAAAR